VPVDPSQPPLAPGPVHGDPAQPTVVYNQQIHPLVPFALRGVLYHHDEASPDDPLYSHKLQALAAGLRRVFRRPSLCFAYTQRAHPGMYDMSSLGNDVSLDHWAGHRERQRRALGPAGVGLIVTADVENYPGEVASRLARWALCEAYGGDGASTGPIYRRHRVEGGEVVVEFDNAQGGLMAAGYPEFGKPLVGTAEALGMIGTDDRRTYELAKKLVIDGSPRVRTIAARLTKFRIKKHEHNVGVAYALLETRPFGDRTSVESVTNVLNHARLTGPVDLKTMGRFFESIGPGQGGEFVGDLGDALRRIKMDDGDPSLNHPDVLPGVLNLYSIGCRNYMLYGVERWIARPQSIPAFQAEIEELHGRIVQLRGDKPDDWQDLVARYEDAIDGLTQLVERIHKSK